MKPELITELDDEHYVYAYCKCELPMNYALKIPRKDGQIKHHFKCENCGLEGWVYSGGIKVS